MLVQFRPSRLACHGFDFGDGEQQFLGLPSDFIRFLQGDTRKGTDIYGKRTFVERREEAASQREEAPQGCDEKRKRGAQYDFLVRQSPRQSVLVMLF